MNLYFKRNETYKWTWLHMTGSIHTKWIYSHGQTLPELIKSIKSCRREDMSSTCRGSTTNHERRTEEVDTGHLKYMAENNTI